MVVMTIVKCENKTAEWSCRPRFVEKATGVTPLLFHPLRMCLPRWKLLKRSMKGGTVFHGEKMMDRIPMEDVVYKPLVDSLDTDGINPFFKKKINHLTNYSPDIISNGICIAKEQCQRFLIRVSHV